MTAFRLAALAAAALTFATAAFADAVPVGSEPVALTLNDLASEKAVGGWTLKIENPGGMSMTHGMILKPDFTYENSLIGTGPGGAPISAIGNGFWAARIAADGSVEITTTRDPKDPEPGSVYRLMSNGQMADAEGRLWTRGP